MTAAHGTKPQRRPIVDPHLAEIDRQGLDPLVPVPPGRLNAVALRARFAAPPPWEPEYRDEPVRYGDAEGRPAAVLVPIVDRREGPTVLLTQRTAHLSSHAGQIAFPGGRTETYDVSPAATALREAHEEIGLDRGLVEVLGSLPLYKTGSGYQVTPVVGIVDPRHTLVLDRNEVDDAFEVPLAFLMDPANHQRRRYRLDDGGERTFVAMPWRSPLRADREYFIWGATAAMLRNFYRFLAA